MNENSCEQSQCESIKSLLVSQHFRDGSEWSKKCLYLLLASLGEAVKVGMLLLFLGVDKINFSDTTFLPTKRQECRNISSSNHSWEGVKYFFLCRSIESKTFLVFLFGFVKNLNWSSSQNHQGFKKMLSWKYHPCCLKVYLFNGISFKYEFMRKQTFH